METIFMFHNSKWYYPIWALLFVLSLVLLWFNRKHWKKGYDAFFWVIILSAFIVYNPLLANALVPRFLPSYGEYERLAWIFFEIPLISYILIMITFSFSKHRCQHLFIAAYLVLLIFFGSPDNHSYYMRPQNIYKIPQDSLAVCNIIDALNPKGTLTLCVQLTHWSIYDSGNGIDGAFYYGIRMNESRFRMRHNSIDPEQYSKNDFRMNEDLSEDIDYYLCPKEDVIYRELERLGYSYVDESANFAVFHNDNKPIAGEGK